MSGSLLLKITYEKSHYVLKSFKASKIIIPDLVDSKGYSIEDLKISVYIFVINIGTKNFYKEIFMI